MTRRELPAQAVNIQRAIASVASCTPATVESLRCFLLPKEKTVTQSKKTDAKAPRPKSKGSSARPIGPAGARARKPPVVDVLEVSEDTDAQVQIQDRIALATEVVNATLKALSEAIRNPPSQKRRAPLRRTSSSASFKNGVESRSQTPLQPISVNRLANTPRKKDHLRRSSSAVSIDGRLMGIRAQAECSRIAFASLRSIQGRNGSPPMPHLQLESGMSALIGRLITLGLDDLATKEIRILKRRLEAATGSLDEQKATKTMLPSVREDVDEPKPEILVDMLKFSTFKAQGLLLALIITTQLQVLKILALKREASLTEAALQHLRLGVVHSPVNMIQQQISSESPNSQDKAAHQLESLAQALIALCPSSSSAEDYKLSKSGNNLAPHTAFEYQFLAFQVRSVWWKISGHRTEVATEIINPFARCMATFHRRSKMNGKEKYELAMSAFEFIMDITQATTGFQEGMLLAVYQVFADMAQENSQHIEASRWVKKCAKSAKACGVSQTRLCILDCRLASLMVRGSGSGSSENLLESLQAAANSLAGNLQGDSAELDELLTTVASLRRSSFSVVQDAHKQNNSDKMRTPVILDTCSEIVLLCVKFLLRYVGNSPSRQEDEKTITRREQRRGLAAQVAYSVIESVAAMASLSAKATTDQWLKLDRGLQDCWRLAQILEAADIGEKRTSDETRPSTFRFVAMSNAYWYRYLHLKQVSADKRALNYSLQMSIDIIRNGSACERTAGCLPTKLEKYAQLCESVRDYKKATETYQETLKIHIGNGLLSTAAEAATTRSMPYALEDNGALAPLSQILVAYPKAALKANEQGGLVDSFYDDDKLCDGERGVLLEQQLIALLCICQDQGTTPMISVAMTALAQTLLGLYTAEIYPVRRFRVIVRLLAVLSADPYALDDANREQVLRQHPADLTKFHQDVHLLGYLPHLTVCRDVLINLINGTLEVGKVEAAMASWSKLLYNNPTWNALQLQVYDISDWLSQLELLAGYLDMQGLGLTRVSVLHLLVTVHEASTSTQCLTLVSKIMELGLQYSRVGYSGAAEAVLRKAEQYLATSKVPAQLWLRFHLVQAEVAHTNGSPKRWDHLDQARELFQEDATSVDNQRLRSKDQSERSQLMGDAAYLLSLLASAEGHSPKALYLARLCVKSYQRAWAIMERKSQMKDVAAQAARKEAGDDAIAESLSGLAISECETVDATIEPHSPSSPCGAAFWGIVPRLSRGFIHLSSIFAHHGLLPEARYSLDQAQRIVSKVHAQALDGQHSALLGQHMIRGGQSEEGLQCLRQAESMLSGIPRGGDYATLQISFASHYARQKQWQAGQSALDVADTTVRKLMKKSFMDTLIHAQTILENLDLQLSTLTLKEIKRVPKPKPNPRITAVRKNSMTKQSVSEDVTVSSADEITGVEVPALKRIKGEVLLGRASAALDKGDLEIAGLLLSESLSTPCDERGIVSQALLTSRIRYGQKLEQLVADPVFCVIPESTIAHPSIRAGGDRKQLQSTPHAPLRTLRGASVRNQRGKTSAYKRKSRSPSLCKAEPDILHLAQRELCEVVMLARKISSTKTLHKITDALGKIYLLLSATSSASKAPLHPAFVVYTLEIGRILSRVRESAAIDVERHLSVTKVTHHWPEEHAFEYDHSIGANTALDFATFQAEYIDIIPSSWTTMSMTLTESREELLICKIRAGQSPFILRLPLTRHNPLESDEEIFGFDQGREELQEIVLCANQSSHGAQDLSGKGAKSEWWEARTALDARLKDLLHNIESIWFGGFKSIFSHAVQDSNLLARFHQSLQNILDKHLPSRRKSGRGTQCSRITLDQSVLELFVGLGNPSESDDVEEPLMDLLYFVVDIMQFNGERNAYDEIDFDSITVETIDALRHYHQAVKDEVESNEEQHTILILDKHLHCFPWESLPCLSGQPVSRLPSLKCLRDRIMQQRKANGGDILSSGAGRLYVNRNNGVSILNPGGDLKATQSRFEEPLQDLPGWENIVQREPTETEMKDCLENHEILLYFGHGSGGQYIRSRTIKKLDKCAVALLMGCSSGALTEAGEFEPYGTPMNYMHAGCPAMLATLWDVTDKDIDKFSYAVLEKWGLFGQAKPPEFSGPIKKSAKQRGKSKVRDIEEPKAVEKGAVSLDEAVAQARESCLLKYLNGAAPVVYGVPVFLS